MLFSALVVVVGNGGAEVINTDNTYGVYISWTTLDDSTRFRGENVSFDIRIGTQTTIDNCNLSISSTVRDADGNTVTSPFIWHTQDVPDDVTISSWSYHTFSGFSATIRPDTLYGTYNITAHLSFKDSDDSSPQSYEGCILFDVGPRVVVTGQTTTYPGEIGHPLNLDLNTPTDIHDVYWNISVPDSDFQFAGDNPSVASAYKADVYYYSSWWPEWSESYSFNVTKNKAPGWYMAKCTVEYTLNGERIRDENEINITVKSLGTIEMSSDVSQIDRGISTMNISFSFTNTGNVNLSALKIRLDQVSRDYFIIPQEVERYEGDTPIYKDEWVSIGDISMGQTASKAIKIIIDSHLPAGQHKVLFDFKADFENGTVQSSWRWDSSPDDGSSAHYMPYWNLDVNGASFSYQPDDSKTLHEGAYVMFDVVGEVFDMEITPSLGLSQSTASLIREENTLSFTVQNNENRNYRDLSFFVSTASSSPFVNTKNVDAPWSEPYNVSRLYGGRSAGITLQVKMRAGTLAGYYDIPIKVTATDVAGGNTVENEVTTRMLITGSGANPVITSISAGDIKAGKTFTVTLNVKNTGDDVARNLQVRLAVQNLLGDSDVALLSGAPVVDSLEPGENTTFQFTFVAASHMKGGGTYPIDAEITYDNMFRGDSDSQTQQIGIQSQPGLPIDLPGILMILLVILVLIGIIGGIMFIRGPRKIQEVPTPVPPLSAQEYGGLTDDTVAPQDYGPPSEPPAPNPSIEPESEEQGEVLKF